MEVGVRTFIEFLITLPLLAFCYQFFSLAAMSTGVEKQRRCQKLGIIYMTIGVTALVFRSLPFVFFGLILMMSGMRLLAKGLDRIDKKTFIDRYTGNE
jgi:hypothetical protein